MKLVYRVESQLTNLYSCKKKKKLRKNFAIKNPFEITLNIKQTVLYFLQYLFFFCDLLFEKASELTIFQCVIL